MFDVYHPDTSFYKKILENLPPLRSGVDIVKNIVILSHWVVSTMKVHPT